MRGILQLSVYTHGENNAKKVAIVYHLRSDRIKVNNKRVFFDHYTLSMYTIPSDIYYCEKLLLKTEHFVQVVISTLSTRSSF